MSYNGRSSSSYGQIRRAQRFHARRTPTARHIDERLKAPLAKSVDQWLEKPNRLDLPEVDAPEKAEEKKHLNGTDEEVPVPLSALYK